MVTRMLKRILLAAILSRAIIRGVLTAMREGFTVANAQARPRRKWYLRGHVVFSACVLGTGVACLVGSWFVFWSASISIVATTPMRDDIKIVIPKVGPYDTSIDVFATFGRYREDGDAGNVEYSYYGAGMGNSSAYPVSFVVKVTGYGAPCLPYVVITSGQTVMQDVTATKSDPAERLQQYPTEGGSGNASATPSLNIQRIRGEACEPGHGFYNLAFKASKLRGGAIVYNGPYTYYRIPVIDVVPTSTSEQELRKIPLDSKQWPTVLEDTYSSGLKISCRIDVGIKSVVERAEGQPPFAGGDELSWNDCDRPKTALIADSQQERKADIALFVSGVFVSLGIGMTAFGGDWLIEAYRRRAE